MRRCGPYLTLALVLLTLPLAVAQPVIWPGNGHTYEAIAVTGGITWPAAQQAAMTAGGHLATITSLPENTFVFGLAGGTTMWLGGTQPPGSPEPAGGWQWITGEPFNFTNWDPSEPNNSGNEDKIHFWNSAGQWNDWSGSNSAPGYVIEYSLPSTPEYQSNSVLATLAVNGVWGTAYSAATVTVPIGVPATLQLGSLNIGMVWELGLGLAPLVPVSSGALITSDNQFFNLDLTDPSFIMMWNFFQSPGFQNVTIPFSVPNAVSLSAQMLVLDPFTASGLSLSQPTRLIVQ